MKASANVPAARVVAIALLLVGGAMMTDPALSQNDAQSPVLTVEYRCDDGTNIIAHYEGQMATLTDAAGHSVSLTQQRMASGTLYTGGGHRLQGKGNAVSWTTPEAATRNCVSTPADALPGLKPDGDVIVHVTSGMRFPAKVGSAVRLPSRPYDLQDDMAMVRYQVPLRDGGMATARIGLVHIEEMTPHEHFAAFEPRLLARIPGGVLQSEGPFPIAGAQGDGWRGNVVGTDQAGGLITANFGYWSARLVTDYPRAQMDEAQAAITAFVTALDWTPIIGKQPK